MPSKKFKILILDDDDSIRESLKMYFDEMGYDVVAASQPNSCPVYHHENCTRKARCADAMLTDQNMPEMTGLEFIRRQAERGCKLPPQYKLVMTGELTDILQAKAEDFGCQIVEKPFSLAKARDFILAVKAAQENED